MKRIWIPQAIVTPMLFGALIPENPYGYYLLLRYVCCVAFTYLTIQAFIRKKQTWIWILGATAILYNPLIRIHLTRETWLVVNLITIGIAWCSCFFMKTGNEA